MNKTGDNNLEEKKNLKTKGNKALIINIAFFVILFGGMILVPLSGFLTAAVVIILAFIASLFYIYLS